MPWGTVVSMAPMAAYTRAFSTEASRRGRVSIQRPMADVDLGQFMDGKAEEPFTLIRASGERVEQTWKNGELVK